MSFPGGIASLAKLLTQRGCAQVMPFVDCGGPKMAKILHLMVEAAREAQAGVATMARENGPKHPFLKIRQWNQSVTKMSKNFVWGC